MPIFAPPLPGRRRRGCGWDGPDDGDAEGVRDRDREGVRGEGPGGNPIWVMQEAEPPKVVKPKGGAIVRSFRSLRRGLRAILLFRAVRGAA